MRKKLIGCLLICCILVLFFYYISFIKNQEKEDPYREIANKIYHVDTILDEMDMNFNKKSITKITPYTYVDSKGNSIVYYCCNTQYFDSYPDRTSYINTSVIGQVIDLTAIENAQECLVNSWHAIHCEKDGVAYLCWTISPEISCIIEYIPGNIVKEDIMRMAQSVNY